MSPNLNKTIEQLEKKYWETSSEESYLITTCSNLRKKPLNEFEIEDLRIMIGQNIGLQYLIPIAINTLKENILAEGDFYKGDLLKSVLNSEIEYWKVEKNNWKSIIEIFESNISLLKETETDFSIRKGWFESFENFKKINS